VCKKSGREREWIVGESERRVYACAWMCECLYVERERMCVYESERMRGSEKLGEREPERKNAC